MSYANKVSDEAMLLVIALPEANSQYYKDVYDKILAFDIADAKVVMGHDNIVILANQKGGELLRDEFPADIILHHDMRDIWIRDFVTVLPSSSTLYGGGTDR